MLNCNQKYHWSSSCNVNGVNVDFTSISARKVKIKIYYYASTSHTALCYPRLTSWENPYLDNKSKCCKISENLQGAELEQFIASCGSVCSKFVK